MQAEQYIENMVKRPTLMRIASAAGVAAFVGGSSFVALNDPSQSHMFPICPLFTLTGIACPGCGLTRGFHALLHGDLLTALDFNALVLVWAAVFLWSALSLGLLAVRGRGLVMWPLSPRFMWPFLYVLVAFGVLRNLPFFPFSVLYP